MNSYQDHLQQAPNLALSKTLERIGWVVSAAVLLLVGVMQRVSFELPDGMSLAFLPMVHAILNSCVAVLLIAALIAIKKKNIAGHKRAISGAMLCSAVFLLCYVAYHITNEPTKYGGEGTIRIVYYVLLATHIVFAAISFPAILMTWIFGYTHQFARHRKWSKIVFPVWLYVAITGPICYLMLRPYY